MCMYDGKDWRKGCAGKRWQLECSTVPQSLHCPPAAGHKTAGGTVRVSCIVNHRSTRKPQHWALMSIKRPIMKQMKQIPNAIPMGGLRCRRCSLPLRRYIRNEDPLIREICLKAPEHESSHRTVSWVSVVFCSVLSEIERSKSILDSTRLGSTHLNVGTYFVVHVTGTSCAVHALIYKYTHINNQTINSRYLLSARTTVLGQRDLALVGLPT